MTKNDNKPVYVVDGARTPFLKGLGKVGAFTAADLAVAAGRQLLARQKFSTDLIEEVIVGCMIPSADEANIARIIALRLGLNKNVPAWTVQRNCASGLQALDNAFQSIRQGRHHLVLAGGTDAMSHGPLLVSQKLVKWLVAWNATRNWKQGYSQRFKLLGELRPSFLAPIPALLKGLKDPLVGLSMGQTAEIIAHHFNISREQMDQYAVSSHQRLAGAMESGLLSEIVPLYENSGKVHLSDEGLRPDSTVEKLAKLKPAFDKPYGKVTPGNSSQVTDGAAFLLLASEEAVEKHNLPVLGKIIDCAWAGLDPAQMGLGPVYASSKLLKQNSLTRNDIDFWEINEAFAAQVLACVEAFKDEDFCQKELGLAKAFGEINLEQLNVNGGAVALGHPIGASGARCVLHLLHVLKQRNAKRGVASLCIGGGQGGAMLIESKGV